MATNGVVFALRSMAGIRNRCMYCGDSEACDIEHFRPKGKPEWRANVFDWGNFLWICQPCNRLKNSVFPVMDDGWPMMLDPAIDRIWDFFDFSPETGYLVPISEVGTIAYMRAAATVSEGNSRLSYEVILGERQRAYRNLKRSAQIFFSSEQLEEDVEGFIQATLDSGYPELVEWAYSLRGREIHPFSSLSNDAIFVERLRSAMNNAYPGVW
ncbi:hypothetical protein [Dokdonella sp.]|uniref:hypothetical protein n=1 Tax=Dokdonella sp. TaxID=2291710 RepID=UPI001B249ADA|nr:hypothetical protein [Dokdonella sp.]MBO9663426.1 hypothetical protein [Dokdonella sp.]